MRRGQYNRTMTPWDISVWILLTLLGGIVTWAVVKAGKETLFYFRAIPVCKKLLESNRPTRNSQTRWLRADRFLDIAESPRASVHGRLYRHGDMTSVFWEDAIDEELRKLGLVELYDKDGQRMVKLSPSLLSKHTASHLKRLNRVG